MINTTALRTAITTGLANGFASLSGVQDSQYAALAVLSVATGSYGGAFELGRQRLLGSVLGAVVLLVGHRGLTGLPMPLGLALTLGALRLLGGLLQLKVGYKVGGMIIVMGWLVHEGSLASWLPLRFFWTAFGVLLTLLSLRLFWPARTFDRMLSAYATLLGQLQLALRQLAEDLQTDDSGIHPADQPTAQASRQGNDPALRNQLQTMRALKPTLLQELGSIPQRHPAVLLLAAMADQLRQWERVIRASGPGLPQPPPQPLQLPASWLELNQELNNPAVNTAACERLERIAVRLQLCRQAERAIRDGEARWAAILGTR